MSDAWRGDPQGPWDGPEGASLGESQRDADLRRTTLTRASPTRAPTVMNGHGDLSRKLGRKEAFALLALAVAHATHLLPIRAEALVDGALDRLFAESFHLCEARR